MLHLLNIVHDEILAYTVPENTHNAVYKSWRVNIIQWNHSIPDTNGAEESVLIREVSLFQGLNSTQTWYLGRKKVSCLERCPYIRGVLIEGFHCMYYIQQLLLLL